MSTINKTPNAQWILSASFAWNVAATGSAGGYPATSDRMVNINGVLTAVNAVTASTPTFDVMTLPQGAEVISGDVTVLVVSNDAGAATLSVGDSGSATRYLSAQDVKSAIGTFALVPTGYQTLLLPIRLTFANNTGGATTGSGIFRVNFVINGRANENMKTT